MSELREIVLHGALARRYGKHHRFAVETAAEAVRALAANFPGFEQYLATSHEHGVAYQVWVNGENVGAEDLRRHSAGRIYLSPVLQGSKQAGLLQTIVGIILIVVGVIGETFGAEFGGDVWGPYLIYGGVAMLAGGLMRMMSGVPNQDNKNRLKSAFFDGPVNTTAQGNPVPVGYGRMIVGSAVISAGISIEDLSTASGGGGGASSGTGTWAGGIRFQF
jgi:predicted phage tail protein